MKHIAKLDRRRVHANVDGHLSKAKSQHKSMRRVQVGDDIRPKISPSQVSRRAKTPPNATTRQYAVYDDDDDVSREMNGCKTQKSQEAIDAQIGEYEIGRLIGSGMIGVVAVARHVETKQIAVLKCMSWKKIKEKNLIKNIQTEVDIHYTMSGHPYILPLEKLLIRENEAVMVFPYIVGRDLYKFMRARRIPKGHLTEYQAHLVFRQLIQAIKACHENRIIHRDIKPENIMIDDDFNIFLGDFGLAVRMVGDQHYGKAGTPCYYPYEMVRNMRYD